MPESDQLNVLGVAAEDKWEHDVWLMARRAALLYHYLSKAMIDRLGAEEGRKLLSEAVWQYGEHIGRETRAAVDASGLSPTLENFYAFPDLPSRGWRKADVPQPDGTTRSGVTHCPLAHVWLTLGQDLETARIYCLVDQSKIAGYNGEDYECVHARNVLDGDPHCEVVFRPKKTE